MNYSLQYLYQVSVALLIGLRLTAPAVMAQDQPQRTAEYMSPSFQAAMNVAGIPASASLLTTGVAALPETLMARPESTDADRWIAFEREYGIRERDSSWVLSLIQTAKFGLDKLTFGAKETARKLEFSYDIGNAGIPGPGGVRERPAYSLPLFGNFGQPQVKTVLTEHDPYTSTAFLGLRMKIPFGQGAAEY